MTLSLKGKRVLVVGLAKSGVAAARLCAREGAQLACVDRREAGELQNQLDSLRGLPIDFKLGPHERRDFLGHDFVVVSPGVPLALPEIEAAREAGAQAVGEVELASWFLKEPLIGITGTNGKSTTTALTAAMCSAAGLETFAGGNLGRPLSERALEEGGDVAVVELSSFQLEGIERLRPRVAAVLNLTPDHIDRYPSHEVYGKAKRRIFMSQEAEDFAVANAADAATLAMARSSRGAAYSFGAGAPEARAVRDDGKALVYMGADGKPERYTVGSRALRGAHNRENAMAALLCARLFGVKLEAVQAALDTFPGLPHRMQFIRVLRGVEYINDSKATNVESTVVALKVFSSGVVLIAGGRGKGAPYAPLVELGRGRLRAVLTIGEDAPAIEAAFRGQAELKGCGTLGVAVAEAQHLAREGDVVLLSPACASYDQFKNFEHRGEEFSRLVNALR